MSVRLFALILLVLSGCTWPPWKPSPYVRPDPQPPSQPLAATGTMSTAAADIRQQASAAKANVAGAKATIQAGKPTEAVVYLDAATGQLVKIEGGADVVAKLSEQFRIAFETNQKAFKQYQDKISEQAGTIADLTSKISVDNTKWAEKYAKLEAENKELKSTDSKWLVNIAKGLGLLCFIGGIVLAGYFRALSALWISAGGLLSMLGGTVLHQLALWSKPISWCCLGGLVLSVIGVVIYMLVVRHKAAEELVEGYQAIKPTGDPKAKAEAAKVMNLVSSQSTKTLVKRIKSKLGLGSVK